MLISFTFHICTHVFRRKTLYRNKAQQRSLPT